MTSEANILDWLIHNWQTPAGMVLSSLGVVWFMTNKLGFKRIHFDIGSDEPKSNEDACKMLIASHQKLVDLTAELVGSVKVIESGVSENTRTLVEMEKNNIEVRRGIIDSFKDLSRTLNEMWRDVVSRSPIKA